MSAHLEIASFRADITPPPGYPLCAGWYPPCQGVADRLSANGVILYPEGQAPILLCALDWAELSNGEYLLWTERLAQAAGTTAERVALHCIHAHDAPWPDRDAQRLLDAHGFPGVIMDEGWANTAIEQVARAAKEARREPVDAIHAGRGRVERVASNRRIIGVDGKSLGVRWTRCRDAGLRAYPEGSIDPWLKTVSFHQGGRMLAALHYYAVHPTSYDGTGLVTHDFVGIARETLAREDGAAHLYFTECAGDITCGKYNDGVADNRALFTGRILAAMREARCNAKPIPAGPVRWVTRQVVLPPLETHDPEAILADPQSSGPARSRAALILAYRARQAQPITISALHLGEAVAIVHLPGEAFMAYQLYAQSLRPGAMVMAPSYGDCGPGYIPLAQSYEEGGYEPEDAFCSPESEAILRRAIAGVLAD